MRWQQKEEGKKNEKTSENVVETVSRITGVGKWPLFAAD